MTGTGRVPVVVDCDPGHDDLVALLLADLHADLLGITTVGGNAPLAAVTRNALITTELFGITAPVHAGAERPLVAPPQSARAIHGEDGFAGADVAEPQRAVASNDAVGFLVDTARRVDGLWWVAIGPLTNVALALRTAPDVAGRLGGISFMGGSATVGNHTAAAEFNASVDPEALDAVLRSGVPLKMAGLDLTSQFVIDAAFEDDVRAVGTRGSRVLAALVHHYLDRRASSTGARSGGLHDPCAVLAITHPDVIEHHARHVAVELHDPSARGRTVVGPGGGAVGEEANVQHGVRLDAAAARTVVLDALRRR